RAVKEADAYSTLSVAFSKLGQGRISEAIATYEKLQTMGALGASFASSGLGDAASVEGRYTDAVRILEAGARSALAEKNASGAAAKFAAIAHAHSAARRNSAASAAASKVVASSRDGRLRFLAARVFVEAGDVKTAEPIVTDLSRELSRELQAYAKIIEANISLKKNDPRTAITLLTEANGLVDMWIGHFDLGRAYLDVSAFAQADAEFDRCLKRRGEALSLFLDEEPTYAFLPQVYYYQGRARDGLKIPSAELYRSYVALRGQSKEDPLVADARQRSGQ